MRYLIAILLLTVGASGQNYIAATTNPVPMYDTRYTMGPLFTNCTAWYIISQDGSNFATYGAADYSTNRAFLTQTNGARPVFYGRSIGFDGVNDCLTGTIVRLGNAFTLSAHISHAVASAGNKYILAIGSATNTSFYAFVGMDASGNARLGAIGNAGNALITGPSITSAIPRHIVLTSETTSNYTAYINGVMVGVTNVITGNRVALTQLSLGVLSRDVLFGYFKGTGCCYSVFNRAMTATEVTNLYMTTAGHP